MKTKRFSLVLVLVLSLIVSVVPAQAEIVETGVNGKPLGVAASIVSVGDLKLLALTIPIDTQPTELTCTVTVTSGTARFTKVDADLMLSTLAFLNFLPVTAISPAQTHTTKITKADYARVKFTETAKPGTISLFGIGFYFPANQTLTDAKIVVNGKESTYKSLEKVFGANYADFLLATPTSDALTAPTPTPTHTPTHTPPVVGSDKSTMPPTPTHTPTHTPTIATASVSPKKGATVTNKTTKITGKLSVSGATVKLYEGKKLLKTVKTDKNGQFVFNKLNFKKIKKNTKIKLVAAKKGYNTWTTTWKKA